MKLDIVDILKKITEGTCVNGCEYRLDSDTLVVTRLFTDPIIADSTCAKEGPFFKVNIAPCDNGDLQGEVIESPMDYVVRTMDYGNSDVGSFFLGVMMLIQRQGGVIQDATITQSTTAYTVSFYVTSGSIGHHLELIHLLNLKD